MKKIKIYFDGACNNHLEDKPMGIGVAVFIDDKLSAKFSFHQTLGKESTSNMAEWLACVSAMNIAKSYREENKDCSIRVFSDSQLITNQFNGLYQVRNIAFANCVLAAHEDAYAARVRLIEWIPRKLNTVADELSKEGLQQFETDNQKK